MVRQALPHPGSLSGKRALRIGRRQLARVGTDGARRDEMRWNGHMLWSCWGSQ